MSDVTICVLSNTAPHERCMASLKELWGWPYPVVQINDTFPYHTALNQMARRCHTPYILQVPGYAMLEPTAVNRLVTPLRVAPMALCVLGTLGIQDPLPWGDHYVWAWRRWPLRVSRFRDRLDPECRMANLWRWVGLRNEVPVIGLMCGHVLQDLPEYVRFGFTKLHMRRLMATRNTNGVNDYMRSIRRLGIKHVFPELWGATFALLDREHGSPDGRMDFAQYEALRKEITFQMSQGKVA